MTFKQENPPVTRRAFCHTHYEKRALDRPLDLTRPETTRANCQSLWAALDQDAHLLDIRRPDPVGLDVRVAHFMTEADVFATYSADFRQGSTSPRYELHSIIAVVALQANWANA